ncbi:uncharacterized protein H6S33_004976 [Morchella sextelata]|uniref:uncharacterized protein n=1 Tax=Morchella sextelata TaxID=1174677 RepID=UPI001D056789|nr:uncharacterized protein H6S33_004976 [Morchella sextelata]KAH0604994.1 hypothetical protein H6S33_004976 [Morchella sextelata]
MKIIRDRWDRHPGGVEQDLENRNRTGTIPLFIWECGDGGGSKRITSGEQKRTCYLRATLKSYTNRYHQRGNLRHSRGRGFAYHLGSQSKAAKESHSPVVSIALYMWGRCLVSRVLLGRSTGKSVPDCPEVEVRRASKLSHPSSIGAAACCLLNKQNGSADGSWRGKDDIWSCYACTPFPVDVARNGNTSILRDLSTFQRTYVPRKGPGAHQYVQGMIFYPALNSGWGQ